MNKPIIALDFQTYEEVETFLAKFSGETLSVKVGMELFIATVQSLLKNKATKS